MLTQGVISNVCEKSLSFFMRFLVDTFCRKHRSPPEGAKGNDINVFFLRYGSTATSFSKIVKFPYKEIYPITTNGVL